MIPLLKLELRLLIRERLTWIALGLLAVAMVAGSLVGAERVRAQQATIARVQAEAAQSIITVKAAARRYAMPSDIVIPVFRDPTDAYSYMYNFLQTYAVKPPAPLAAVATGQSDLQPTHIRINLQSVFPDTAYELRSPRILALGSFDLAFVLVYLLPLAVIALGGSRLSQEQDSGILRLIAAQPIAPATVALAKFGALALLIAPASAAAALLALVIVGGIGAGAGIGEIVVLGAAVALYALFWVALCALVASFWRGAVQSMAILVLSWAAMTVVLPAVAALLSAALWPAPSRIAYIDRSRALADEVPDSYEWEAGATRWLADRPELGPARPETIRSAEVGRMAHDSYFRARLAPQRQAFAAHTQRMIRAADVSRLLSPASMLDGGLQKLAQTDVASQVAFEHAADWFSQTLRGHFEPLILANIGRDRPCAACPGRLNFAAYDAVPRFLHREEPDNRRALWIVSAYLLAVSMITALWAGRRLVRWPL